MKNNENGLMLFEGKEVLILTKNDVNFDFIGDYIISVRGVADSLEYQGNSATNEVLKFCKKEHIYLVKNSNMVNRHVRKIHNTGEKFISNYSLYRVMGQTNQSKAEDFQKWLYEDTLPTIQKHGMYAIDDLLDNPDLLIMTATKLKEERELRLTAEREKERLQLEVGHKENVIIGLVDEISLAEKRQVLVQVVRKGGRSKVQDRWSTLYRQFEMKYHINLRLKYEKYNLKHKPKLKNKLEYIDKVMNKLPELYEIACKLYENDVKQLVQEMYELNNGVVR